MTNGEFIKALTEKFKIDEALACEVMEDCKEVILKKKETEPFIIECDVGDVMVNVKNIDDICSVALANKASWYGQLDRWKGVSFDYDINLTIGRGGSLIFYLIKPFDRYRTKKYRLTLENMQYGIGLFLNDTKKKRPEELENFLEKWEDMSRLNTNNISVQTVDTIIQYSLFKKVKFAQDGSKIGEKP